MSKNFQNKEYNKIETTQINPILNSLYAIQSQLNKAAGTAVAIEMRMRLIGQFSSRVRDLLKDLVSIHNTEHPDYEEKTDKYWKCDLCFLDQAIEKSFRTQLNEQEQKALLKFRNLRNGLLHANFIKVMECLDISTKSRKALSSNTNNDKDLIERKDIEEAVKAINTHQGFQQFLARANVVISILDRLLKTLVSKP